MSINGFNMPTEIPWERICVTKDMLDQGVCDEDMPGKWRSSIAVFKYVPEDEYQTYPNREISYLKLAVTICGFQSRDKEIEGRIDWSGVSNTIIKDVEKLLNSYYPCTGAIIQLTVAPKKGRGQANVNPEDYPYIMDFQPKKRELYEMATDTKEHSSRSLESLNLRKASGTTQSLEILDVDMGGSAGGSFFFGALQAQASYQEQRGTKRISSEEESIARSVDQARERRETQSHTTQLSQLYHLFDSYHLGTNRGVFFIQPRPHTLEEPSGFVRGPRPVEGIQEIFIVVNRPKDGPDYCVSVRLDTAHYVEVPVMDYEWRDEEIEISANVSPPGYRDPSARPAPRETLKNSYNNWSTVFDCFFKDDRKSLDWLPPGPDFIIDVSKNGGFTVLFEEQDHGKNEHFVELGVLKLRSEATSHSCIMSTNQRDDHTDKTLPAPSVYAASAKQRVRVHLRSQTPNREVGKRRELMVTTRGLCCCQRDLDPFVEGIVSVIGLEPSVSTSVNLVRGQGLKEEASVDSAQEIRTSMSKFRHGLMTAREANDLSDTIRSTMHQSVAQRANGDCRVSMLDTDLFGDLIYTALLKSPHSSSYLSTPICECLPEYVMDRLRQTLGTDAETLTRHDLMQDIDSLADITGLEIDAARWLRLELLGVPLVSPENSSSTD